MRPILFALPTVYLPHTRGGANVSLDALCRRLAARGCESIVVCGAAPGDARETEPSSEFPYTLLRLPAPIEALGEAIARFAPRAVVIRAPDAYTRVNRVAPSLGRPLHLYFQSAFSHRNYPAPQAGAIFRYAANSPFLARMAKSYFAAPVAMIPPVIEPEAFRAGARGDRRGDAVLFVNPVAIKGVHIAAAIAARLPHRRFLFAPSWPDSDHHPLVTVRLPNVENVPRTDDIRVLLAQTRLLLVPSVWEESSARIVGEAQESGIPAIVSDRGGLDDSVGRGGIAIGLGAPIETWCAAIETLFEDDAKYAALSAGARAHAARPDYQPDAIVARFLEWVDA
jgi:glycosyltransferase involved in cell wall biosynthesis